MGNETGTDGIMGKRRTLYAAAALVWAIVFSFGFYYYNHVDIVSCNVKSGNFEQKEVKLPYSQYSRAKATYRYECSLESAFDQYVKVGIAVDDILNAMVLNDQNIELETLKKRYDQQKLADWERGFPFVLQLKEGSNSLYITGEDGGGKFGLRVAQSYTYDEYLLFFLFVIVPLIYGLFTLLFYVLFEQGWLLTAVRGLSWRWKDFPLFLIIVGLGLRLLLLNVESNSSYQHDFGGHVAFIHYFAMYPFEIPQVDKSLQFPQQPLYYLTAAAVYSLSTALGYNDYEALFAVRSLSVLFALLFMFIGWKLVRLYTRNVLTVNLFVGFLALTPSFVFMGAVINNDALNALLGIWALYEISAYVKRRCAHHFWLASVAVLLAMLTKISSALFAIYFVVILLTLYYAYTDEKEVTRKRILIFGLGVLFVFGFALLKAYIPTNAELRFVNSGLYSNQVIPQLDFGYFFSFHWFKLIAEAQAHVMGPAEIRFSLPTYMYGTMLTGEFDYAQRFVVGTFFKFSTQLLYLLGILHVIGFIAYVYFYRSMTRMQKMLIVPAAINMLLIIKFLSDFWVVCNSDFRYFTPTLGAIGLIFVLGIERVINRFKQFKTYIIVSATLLAAVECYWMLSLLGD